MSEPNGAPLGIDAGAPDSAPEIAHNGEAQGDRRSSQPLSEKTSTPHSVKTGWDGKLRVEKKAVVKNAEAVEDSDQDVESEDELPGETIAADEGETSRT